MKVVILAGGLGTRLSEETELRPKPMVAIGGKPVLWHILKHYSEHGFNEFIICLGYKGYVIKEYFANYFLHESDVTFDMSRNQMEVHNNHAEPWKVTLIDTGIETMTGGRVKRIQPYVNGQTFMLTYGDGLSDVDLTALLRHHRAHGRIGTVTAVQPLGRFGAMDLDESNIVAAFQEKPGGDGSWINGGFFVLEPDVFDYIEDDRIVFERQPLERLAREQQLSAYRHTGFWQPMDTLREKNLLEDLWNRQQAPWKTWKDRAWQA